MNKKQNAHTLDFKCNKCNNEWQVIADQKATFKPTNLLCLFCGNRQIEFNVRTDDLNNPTNTMFDPLDPF